MTRQDLEEFIELFEGLHALIGWAIDNGDDIARAAGVLRDILDAAQGSGPAPSLLFYAQPH